MNGTDDYLSEDTYRPEWLRDGVAELTVGSVLQRREELYALGEKLSSAERYYLIGSGGSYGVQHPIRYLAEKYTTIPVHQFSGWDFLERKPAGVDKNAVCIFLSHSGKTTEVVRALEWARGTGAVTLGIAQAAHSILCLRADHGFDYRGRGVTLGKLTTLYLLFGGLLKERGYKIGSRLSHSTESLINVVPTMGRPAREAAKSLGLRFKDDRHIFVVGGGIDFGLAYQFAMCTLMEMCWVYSTPVDYSEFRHGPIEMFAPGSAAIFLRGREEEAELEDAVIGFAARNGVKSAVFDSLGM